MATVRIYGSSDDLIEIEPIGAPMSSVPGCDEYNFEAATFVLFGERIDSPTQERQTRVRVEYADEGCWEIAVAPVDDGVPMIPCSIVAHNNGYSAEATFENVKSVERIA